MPDDIRKRRVRRRPEILDWASRIGVRPEVLREAIYAVGTDPAKVDIYLKVRKGDRWPERTRTAPSPVAPRE